MKKWVKIIEVDDQQVLFYLDKDKNGVCLHQVISCEDGQTADFVIGAIEPEMVEPVFDSLTEDNARDVLTTLDSILTEQIEVEQDSYD